MGQSREFCKTPAVNPPAHSSARTQCRPICKPRRRRGQLLEFELEELLELLLELEFDELFELLLELELDERLELVL